MSTKGKELTLTEDFIKDYFFHQGNKIVILENKAFKNVDENILILAKIIEDEKSKRIEPLTEEEYDQALKKYEALIDLYENEEE